jgi:hypothetical protein
MVLKKNSFSNNFESEYNVLLPLSNMKKKQLLYHFFFAIALLFSIVFQSFHGYEHLEQQFSQKVCYHKHDSNRAEVTHQHKGFEHCLVCEFTFSSYVTPENQTFYFNASHKEIPYFFADTPKILSFTGSLYSHRGPPVWV